MGNPPNILFMAAPRATQPSRRALEHLGSVVRANLFHKSGHQLADDSLHFSLVSHAASLPRTTSHRGRSAHFL